ncbi:MAG: hypothetical protein HY223_08240 [Thaumarchaeota archaeon]|nr:hypothetical protein [Nitrososphaerota archaeon]
MIIQSRNSTTDEMWQYIEKMLLPYDLVPTKNELTHIQISDLYSNLMTVDELFRILTHIVILKKEVDRLKQEQKT